jgi:Flp pilus assembly protein TadG
MSRRFAIRLRGDERGATLVEFGIVLLPLCVVLMGFFDLGYQSYLRSTLQGALNDVARVASVESPTINAQGNTIEQRIENAIKARMPGQARNGTYTIRTTNYYSYSGSGNPEPLVTDVNSNGRYDAGDCWEDMNPNSQFDLDASRSGRGGADDVVFYEVTLAMPRILPMSGLLGVSNQYSITARAAVRNQPYANQQQPEVRC